MRHYVPRVRSSVYVQLGRAAKRVAVTACARAVRTGLARRWESFG
jgi:hypothetical protein